MYVFRGVRAMVKLVKRTLRFMQAGYYLRGMFKCSVCSSF